MLVFELWKKITILVVCVFSLLFSLTNFIDNKNADLLPNFLNSNKIRLGLDLQGGSYLLLRVEIALLLYVVLTVNAGGSYDAVVTLGLSSDQSDAPEGNAYHE